MSHLWSNRFSFGWSYPAIYARKQSILNELASCLNVSLNAFENAQVLTTYAAFPQSQEMAMWTNDYMRGTGMEMYTEKLSSAFIGMAFGEAAE